MKSLLLISQLLIPQVPADTTILDSIETISCVASAEFDGEAHTLDLENGQFGSDSKILVSVKDGLDVSACAKEVSQELGLEIADIFKFAGVFVIAPEAPAQDEIIPVPSIPEEGVFHCLAIGICD